MSYPSEKEGIQSDEADFLVQSTAVNLKTYFRKAGKEIE